MRATALYTFASVIPLCCAEQPQDYTCKTSTEDTVCAYSSIYSVPPRQHTFTLKLTVPKFFQNYLWHVKKRKKKLLGGIVGIDEVRGEKSHHSSHLPQLLPCILVIFWFLWLRFIQFLISTRKKDAEAQPKCLKLKVAQSVLILPGQLARIHIQTATCGGAGWMSVPIIHELGGIKATVPSKDNLNKFLNCKTT